MKFYLKFLIHLINIYLQKYFNNFILFLLLIIWVYFNK